MAQPPPQGFANRAMTPIRNPVYLYNDNADFKRTGPPLNVLEQPRPGPRGGDERRTVQGDRPPVSGLTPIVPAAYQTPYNVWGLLPA